MSCNGCRVLRKRCNENCILRKSLTMIESPQAQANATVFVANFFGRSALMSFLSSVPDYQRPALFESLLLEGCGRTVNPVNGAVGLLWTGNWHVCKSAVETVLRGGSISAMPQLFSAGDTRVMGDSHNASEGINYNFDAQNLQLRSAGFKEEDSLIRSFSSHNSGCWTENLRTEVSETTTSESATGSAKLLRLFL
ncbi:hypothetical protein OSB04_006799 [Centaurea solstitialis]|uniref:LOB domain-containing protein n=1 Tax=Centaurea solstitialis TaxID=347529 RepID=A0AA38TKE1_9ASTR|nr:hypothetical protein OSB04_006799 [Centaurea solstitialis]